MIKPIKKHTRFYINVLIGLILMFVCISSTHSHKKPHKYTISICALFKNEAKYLKEWIEYHRLIGIDHFYLYNLESKDHYDRVLHPYIKEGIVTLIQWPDHMSQIPNCDIEFWSLGTQIPAYENAIQYTALSETKWLIFSDIKEFLVPPQGNLIELLKQYDGYAGITLSSDYFDAAQIGSAKRTRLIIETKMMAKPPQDLTEKTIAKMIFKPEFYSGFSWPPYACLFKNNKISTIASKQELRMNIYENRNLKKNALSYKDILHMTRINLDDSLITTLLEENYAIEDEENSIYQFIPELKIKMGY